MPSTRAKQRRANEHCRNARAELGLIRWYDCNQTRAAFICERLILHPCAHPTRIKFANRCTHVHHHQHRVYIGGNATRFADFVLLCAKAVRNSSSIRSDTTALLSTTATFKPLTPCRGFISLTLGVNGQFFFLSASTICAENKHYIMHVAKMNKARKCDSSSTLDSSRRERSLFFLSRENMWKIMEKP